MKKLVLGGLIITAIFTLASCSLTKVTLTEEEAKTTAEKFINENLMSPDSAVVISEAVLEGDLFKLKVEFFDGKTVESYLTKDGKKFFAEAMDIVGPEDETESDAVDVAGTEITKTAKPKVELFVMSHCPFGTQIEKGILPVIKALGDSIDFQLKFCDYAMHAKEELDEQLHQYCIQKNQPEKLINYLECFLADGDGAKCVQETGINLVALNQCVKATDQEFQVTEKFNDQSTWISGLYPAFDVHKTDNIQYGVQGSPGLVINSSVVVSNAQYCPQDKPCVINSQMSRSPAGLLSTVCDYFIEQPIACNTGLSAETPSPGFGFESSGADTDAQCE